MPFLIVSVIAAQVIIFIGFIAFFKKVMTSNVVSATKHLDELSQEYDKRDKEINARLEEAKKQSQEIVLKANDEAQAKKDEIAKLIEQEREDVIKKARGQAEAIMQQADKSRELLLSELDQRIAKEAINKAAELVQYALPEELKMAAHSQWVRDLIDSGFDKIGEVKIVEGVKDIKVVSAYPLNDSDRAGLLKKVSGLLGRNADLKEELDPKIVAGIIVEIGNLILDGSLRNKILDKTALLDKKQ